MKGIKPANPPPSLLVSDFRLGGHTSQMTSPHRRGGGKSRRYRRLVTYEQADESREESPHHHSAVRCPARPLRNGDSIGYLTPKGGDGARSAGPKKWGGGEASASVELRGVWLV